MRWSEAGFSNKMATVIEECTTEEQRSVVRFFLWAKELSVNDSHK
jgi:hypothetical protein